MNFKAWNVKDKYMCKSKRSLATIITNQMTGNIIGDGFHCYNKANNDAYILLQGSGLKDKNMQEIFADDVLTDGEITFRVYHVAGGFVMKDSLWGKDMDDLICSDWLIFLPLADAQTSSWIKAHCEILGNYHEMKKNQKRTRNKD